MLQDKFLRSAIVSVMRDDESLCFKWLTADNLSKELFRRVPEERNTAHQELVEDDPHRPPVHWLPIALPEDHLGGNVLRCAAHLRKQNTSSSGKK